VTPRKKPTTAASQARPSSKQDLLSENRPTERGRCHAVVTRSGFGESTGDAKIRFLLVRLRPELLRDNGIRPMSDWGSSGRRFKSCQPDKHFRSSEAVSEEIRGHPVCILGGRTPTHTPTRTRPSLSAGVREAEAGR
jgi:hypothetical protein